MDENMTQKSISLPKFMSKPQPFALSQSPETASTDATSSDASKRRNAKIQSVPKSRATKTEIPSAAPAEVRLTPIPRLAKGGRWRVEAMRSYSTDVLLWFTRGQGRITVAGQTAGYGAHNAIFIPAGTMHGFELSAQVFGTAVFIPRNDALALPSTPIHLRIREATPQSEVTGILESLQREIDGVRPERSAAVTYHTGLLSVWIQRQILLSDLAENTPSAGQRLAAQFSQMIEDSYHEGISVAEYAAALGVSPTHLSRVCNKACGRPALSLLNDRILFEARRRLVETKEPINKVAQDLGFTSAAYFTRAFHAHIGCTPSAFRKQN
jgi:AraC-like DNA-binding protein